MQMLTWVLVNKLAISFMHHLLFLVVQLKDSVPSQLGDGLNWNVTAGDMVPWGHWSPSRIREDAAAHWMLQTFSSRSPPPIALLVTAKHTSEEHDFVAKHQNRKKKKCMLETIGTQCICTHSYLIRKSIIQNRLSSWFGPAVLALASPPRVTQKCLHNQ
jgi:hypothetical protein